MMTDQQLIKQIQELKQIKPRQDWVVLAKRQILSQSQTEESRQQVSVISVLRFMVRARALVPATLVLLIGLFFFTQASLPGDLLHSVKKIAETGQENLVTEENKSEFYLDIAEKRAQELKEIVTANQVAKLSPAIKEYQASLKRAAESLVENSKEPEQIIAIAQRVTVLGKTTEAIKDDLNIEEFGGMELLKDNTLACLESEIEDTKSELAGLAILVGREIQILDRSSLTEKQEELLQEAKEYYQAEDYNEALNKVSEASQLR